MSPAGLFPAGPSWLLNFIYLFIYLFLHGSLLSWDAREGAGLKHGAARMHGRKALLPAAPSPSP